MALSPTKITVDYRELGVEHGLTGGCDEQGEWETKPYLVAYGDRGDFINQMQGLSSMSGGAGGRWNVTLPYQLPDNPRLYATTITWTPEGRMEFPTSPIQYTHAVMMVTFRQPTNTWQGFDDPGYLNSLGTTQDEQDGLVLATQELSFAGDWMTIPNASVKFKSDNAIPKTSQGRKVTVTTMTLTWERFPVMLMGLIRAHTDCVNNAIFLGCPKGTVFYEGSATSRTAAANGAVTQKVQQVFKYRAFDWNKRLRDDGIKWDYVVDKDYAGGPVGNSDASCSYQYLDFSNLLLGKYINNQTNFNSLTSNEGP